MAPDDTQLQTPDPSTTTVIPADASDAPPAPIEIDLDAGTVEDQQPAGAPAAVAPPADPNKPKPQRAQQRIQKISQERDHFQGYAAQLERELQQSRQDAERYRQSATAATTAGMENFEARVKSDISAAKQALIAAKQTGDLAAEADAQEALAKAAAASADIEVWRAGQPAPGQQPQQQPQQQRQPQQQQQPEIAPVSEPVMDWFDANPWFTAVQLGADGRPIIDRATGRPIPNPAFDEDLHDAAMLVHKKIAREIARGTWDGEIESPEYFQRITDELKAQFPDAFEGEPAPAAPARRTPPMAPARQAVAPASRNALPNQSGKPQAQKIVLSSEERQFVDQMVNNGVMRYSGKHPKAGQQMEAKDAYLEYARRRSEQTAAQ